MVSGKAVSFPHAYYVTGVREKLARCQVLASQEHKKVVARGTEGRCDFQRKKSKDDFFLKR